MFSETAALLAPEIVLVAIGVSIYLGGTFVSSQKPWRWIALAGIIASAAVLFTVPPCVAREIPLETDALAAFARWLSLFVGGLLVLLAWNPLAEPVTPEYVGSLVLVTAGSMIVSAAGDLILLFVGLELVSIPTYILLYLGRRHALSQEATAKYFYLSILASAILLYGFSFLYGASGSTDLGEIRARLSIATAGTATLGKIAMAMVLVGLGFRVAAVPFHFYAPDVFQGTTTANAGLLSVVPKIAGLVGLVRLVAIAMPGLESYAFPAVMLLAAFTMTVANVLALWQDNLRRLLAYSSIANAGYMLIGLAAYLATTDAGAVPWDGTGAMLFYLLVYAVATLGMFSTVACLGQGDEQIENLEELAGLAWAGGRLRSTLAWMMGLFLFSLAGVPPLAGFWGKLALIASALSLPQMPPDARPWFVALAILGVLNSAVAAAYYLRIVALMFFRMPLAAPSIRGDASGTCAAVALCAVLVIVMGLYPWPWLRGGIMASPRSSVSAKMAVQPALSANTTFANVAPRVILERIGERTTTALPQGFPPLKSISSNMARPRAGLHQFAQTLNAVDQPVYALDDEVKIVFCNRACLDWLGREAEELQGVHCAQPSVSEPTALETVAAALCPPPEALAGRPCRAVVVCPVAEGRESHRLAQFLPLRGKGASALRSWCSSIAERSRPRRRWNPWPVKARWRACTISPMPFAGRWPAATAQIALRATALRCVRSARKWNWRAAAVLACW